MRAWLRKRQQRLQERRDEIDGQILRPAFEQAARERYPDADEVEIALRVDQAMQLHNRLERR